MNLEKEIYRIIDEIQILQRVSVEHNGRITELEKQAAEHTADPTMAQVEIKVYLNNCDTVSIEPDEFEKQLKKLISNLHKAIDKDNKWEVEAEIVKITAILDMYRQCKKGAVI